MTATTHLHIEDDGGKVQMQLPQDVARQGWLSINDRMSAGATTVAIFPPTDPITAANFLRDLATKANALAADLEGSVVSGHR